MKTVREDAAAIGIGTMVVFVATALVAAVAAGILITAGSDVERQAPEPDLQVVQVIGLRDVPSDAHLRAVDIYVLAHSPMQIDAIELSVRTGTQDVVPARDDPDAFAASAHHDEDGSMDRGSMDAGDILVFRFGLGSASLPVGPGDVLSVRVGHAGVADQVDVAVGLLGDDLVIPL